MLFSIAPRNEPGYCSRRPNGSVCFPDGLHKLFHVHCSTDADEGRVHQDRSAVLDVTLSQTKRFVSCAIARIPARSTSKTIGPQTAHHSIYGTTCQAHMGEVMRSVVLSSGPCSSAAATAASCHALAAAICRSCSQSSI